MAGDSDNEYVERYKVVAAPTDFRSLNIPGILWSVSYTHSLSVTKVCPEARQGHPLLDKFTGVEHRNPF